MIACLLKEYLHGFSGKSILDIGPGFSSFSRLAAQLIGAAEITFVDFDEKVLAWQIEQSRKAGLRVTAMPTRLDEDGINKVEGTFDLIHCQEVLEHLPNAATVLRALTNRLSQNGRIIITVPTKTSERWLKQINPSYMRNEPFGHVNLYDEPTLQKLITEAGLTPLVFVPTQPHYFVAHTWFYGSRMKSEPSSGRIMTGGVRGAVFTGIFRGAKWLFMHTGMRFWGRILPRNYFVIAACKDINS